MLFARMLKRYSTATSIPVLAQDPRIQSTSTDILETNKTMCSKRERVRRGLRKVFPLRRREGVCTVTVTSEMYMPNADHEFGVAKHGEGTVVTLKKPAVTEEYSMAATVKLQVTTEVTQPAEEPRQSSPQSEPSIRQHSRKATPQRSLSTPIFPLIPTALKLREIFEKLAYHAALNNCSLAIDNIQAIESVWTLAQLHVGPGYDPTLQYDGYQFSVGQMGRVEKDWVLRAEVAGVLEWFTDRRLIHVDDGEMITGALFPLQKQDIIMPEWLTLILENLVHEKHISPDYASLIQRLALTIDEFQGGPPAMGRPKSKHQQVPSRTFFHLPNRAGKTRTDALRRLIEAAVYQPFKGPQVWKSTFYADARSKVLDYYKAYELTYRKGISTPPHLTEYKRDWTYHEERMLERANLVLGLITAWEKGNLKDWGHLKYIRGSYFSVPYQPRSDIDQLSSFVYARLIESGLCLLHVPKILILHPEYDDLFLRDPQAPKRAKARLEEEMRDYERLEKERLAAIQTARESLEAASKEGTTKIGRFWMKVTKIFGRKKNVVVPFDPFQDM